MSPYRPLPVVQPERVRVFCKDCRHVRFEAFHEPMCAVPSENSDPVNGRSFARRNKKLDCIDFAPRPWWRFW